MTANEKNRLIGIAFFIFAVVNLILLIAGVLIGAGIMSEFPKNADPGNSLKGLILLAALSSVFIMIFVAIVGYLIMNEYSKTRIVALVAAVLLAFYLPLGTLISIFAFWFFTSEEGYNLYQDSKKLKTPNSR